MVRFIDLDSFGIFLFYFIFGTLLYTSITCVLALVTEFSKKRLFDIFHLAFLSILFGTFESILLFLVLILPNIIRLGLAKGFRLALMVACPLLVAIKITSYHINFGVMPDVYGQKY